MLAAGGRAFGDEGDVGGGDFDDFGEGAEGEGVVDAGLDGGGFGGGDGGGRYCLRFTRRGRG